MTYSNSSHTIHESGTEARQGEKNGIGRRILVISLFLTALAAVAVLAMM